MTSDVIYNSSLRTDDSRRPTPGHMRGRPSTVAGRYDIDAVSNLEGLDRMQHEWEHLAQRTACANPFIYPVWIRAWWQAFGDGSRLHILTVRRNGQLVGVLPLMYSRVWAYGIPVRRLGAISNDHTPRFDLMAESGASGFYEAIWDYLMGSCPSWDMLELPRMLVHSPTLQQFSRLARARGDRFGIWEGSGSPLVRTDLPFDDYMAARSSNFRKNLRRKLRRLSNQGELELETCSRPDQLSDALADGMRIEAGAWKERGGTAMRSEPNVMKFYTTLAAGLVGQDRLRLHFLTLNGQRIAFDYSIVLGDRLFSLKSGYDAEYAASSPGTILFYLMLRHYMARGLVEADLLGETDEFKRQWTQAVRQHHWLVCFSGSARGQLVNAIKFGLLPRMKQVRRRQRHH